jgi:predicted transcriptional regulator
VVLEVYQIKHISKDTYRVTGRTDADAMLRIDGVRYPVDQNGFFSVEADIKEGTDFEIDVQDLNGNTDSKVATARAPPGPPAAFNWSPIGIWASLISIMVVVGLVGGTERGKLWALFFLFVPLYTKIKKNTVLDHYTRGQIHGYIVANPGDHYNSIKESLKLNNGTLAYHLRVLEREGIVKSRSDGIYKRFYPMGMKVPEATGTRLTEIQKIIIKRIRETPGISQKEMARLVGVSPSTINYHISILKSAGIVRSERRGMRVGYFIERFEDMPQPVKDSIEKKTGRRRRKTRKRKLKKESEEA